MLYTSREKTLRKSLQHIVHWEALSENVSLREVMNSELGRKVVAVQTPQQAAGSPS